MPFDPVFHVKHPPSVRLATPADEARLYALLIELYRDNGFGVSMSPQKVADHIRAGTDGKGGVIGVVDAGETIVASVGLFLAQLWFTDDWCLYERWLFVHPRYRQAGLADALFEFAERHRLAMEKGIGSAFPLFTGPTSLNRLPAKMRMWRRHGRQIGAQFVMGLEENK